MIPAIQELNFPKIDGKQYATLSQATATIADMGEKTITTQVKIDGDIVPDFSFDWEVEFQGEKYIMPLRIPQGAKENTSLTSTVDLTFQHWAIYQLKRWPFVTMQPIDTGTAIADEEVADVQLNLKDFCDLFGQVLEYYYGDAITIDLNPAWEYDNASTAIAISHTYIWNVLIDAFHDKYGVRWAIEPREDNDNTIKGGEKYVVKVGYPTTEIDHIFEYGFEGGLLKLERQVQSEDIRNMIKGRGGETNIPFRYFKDTDPNNKDFRPDPDWVEELKTIYFTNLMPATFRSYVQGWKAAHISRYPGYTAVGESSAYAPWAYRKGFTDIKFHPVEFVADEITINPQEGDRQIGVLPGYSPYIKKGSSIDKYGPLLATLDNNEDIYPTIQGTGLDIAVDVEQILSDDVAGSANNDAQIEDTTYPYIVKRNVPHGHATVADAGKRTYFSVPSGKKANIEGYAGVSAYNPENHEDKSLLIAELDYTIKVYDAVTGEQYSASGIPAGSWYFTVEYSFNNTSGEVLNVRCKFNSVKITSATPEDKWSNTFDIWVKNIWDTQKGVDEDGKAISETDAQYAERVWKPVLGDREGNTAKVVFTSGALVHEDYEFTIVDYPVPDTSKTYTDADGVRHDSHWRIRLAKSDAELEATGLYVPSTQKQGKAGDTFAFVGTEMVHKPYVTDAEIRLDDWKKDHLGEVKEIKPTFVVTTDRVRLNNEGNPDALINQLRVGNSLRIADSRFIQPMGDRTYETLYVQSLTYTYREPSSDDAALNPDVEIVLSNEYATTSNPVSVMQGEISSMQKLLGSISNVEQIVRAVGDRLYLRKDGVSDRSLSPTQFFSLLTSGGFRAGLVGGAGWGFFKDENGNWVLEADRVNVRQEMQVNTLVINQAEGRGGMEIDTAAFMEVTHVVETDSGYVCYFDQEGGSVANLFRVDDVAYCNRWTPENTDLKFYKRRVVAVGVDNITLTKGYDAVELPDGTVDTGVNGTGIPAEKDNIIHFGNYTDKTRQYVKVRDVVGGGYERFLDGLDSVNAQGTEYYFVGRQAGRYNNRPRWYIGDNNGYIEWVNGKLTVKGSLSVLSTVGDKPISDYVSDAAKTEADKAKSELQANIDTLQNQVDGVIESFNGLGAPTPVNYPANEWTTDEERKRHDRDIYTDITPYVDDVTTPTSGQSWKWYYNSPTDYGWVKIADSDAVKALQLASMSIRDTDVLYISHTSATEAPALPAVGADGKITALNGWTTAAPSWQVDRYIWQVTYVRKGDGSASFSAPTCISGRDGAGYSNNLLRNSDFKDGLQYFSPQINVSLDTDLLLDGRYSMKSAQVGHTSDKYLGWCYDEDNSGPQSYMAAKPGDVFTISVWVYTDDRDAIDKGCILSIYFRDANGRLKTKTVNCVPTRNGEWQHVSIISEAAPDGTTMVEFRAGIVRNGTIWFNGIKAEYGANPNPVWTPYAEGVGIASITEQYYLSTSRTALAGGSWSDTRQQWIAGRFYWTRSKITYTDGKTTYTDGVCVTGEAGAAGTSALIRYSATGGSNESEWHPAPQSDDKYMQTSVDGGLTWSPAYRFVGIDGTDGTYPAFQWAKNNSAVSEPTSGWQSTPMTAVAGEYVWMRSGTVVPPATTPATWGKAVRLTGDQGQDGEDVYRLTLDNEMDGVICDASGNVTGTYPQCNARVYKGATQLTSGVTYSIAQVSGITAAISQQGVVTLSSLTADRATVTVRAVTAGLTLDSIMTVTKVRPGAGYTDNLLHDSEFRQLPGAWELYNSSYLTIDNTHALEGRNSVKIQAEGVTGNTWSGPRQYYRDNVSPGDVFTASIWAYCEDLSSFSSYAMMELWAADADNNRISAKTINIIPTKEGQWQQFRVAHTMPEGTTTIYPNIWVRNNGTLWISSPKLERGNNPTPVWTPNADDIVSKSVTVNSDSQVFTYEGGFATLVGESTINLSAALQGTTGYQWSYRQGGQSLFVNIAGATTATYALTHDDPIWGSAKSITLRCTSGGVHDEVTIAKVSSGSNGANYSANMLFNGDFHDGRDKWPDWGHSPTVTLGDYNDKNWVRIVTPAIKYSGIQQSNRQPLTAGKTYTFSATLRGASADQNFGILLHLVDSSDIILSQPRSPLFTVGTEPTRVVWSFTVGASLSIVRYNLMLGNGNYAVATDIYITDIKLEEGNNPEPVWSPNPGEMVGEDGKDAYTVLLTNESHTFAGGVDAAEAASTTCEVIAYKGNTRVAATIGSITGQLSGKLTATVNNQGTASTNAKITINVTPALTIANRQGVLTIPVTVDDRVFTKEFSWSVSYKGDDAVVYRLMPAPDTVARDFDGALSHTEAKCSVYRITGSSAPALTAEKTLRYQRLPDGLTGTLAHGSGTSDGVPLLSDTTMVIFELYDGTSYTDAGLLDRQTVQVVTDARDIELGGSNLLPYTNHGPLGWSASVWNPDYDADSTGRIKLGTHAATRGMTMTLVGGLNSAGTALFDPTGTVYQGMFRIPAGTLQAGKRYMLSMMLGASASDASIVIQINRHDFTSVRLCHLTQFVAPASPSNVQRLELPFTAPSNTKLSDGSTTNRAFYATQDLGINIYIKPSGTKSIWRSLTVYDLQLEQGNVATAYKPADDDMDYLTEALRGASKTEGGLMLSSQIRLGEWDTTDPANPAMTVVRAGLNGVSMPAERGGGLVWWGGGDAKDAEDYADGSGATAATRMDGTAYFAGNTIRFGKEYAEIGDNLRLDEDGLKLIKDGDTRLQVTNMSVSDFSQPTSEAVISLPDFSGIGFRFRADLDPETATGPYTIRAITGGDRIVINNGREIPDNSTLNAGIVIQVNATQATYISRFDVYIDLHDSAGTLISRLICQQESGVGQDGGMTLTFSASIHKVLPKGSYWMRVWLGYDNQPDDGAMQTPPVTVTATGGITPGLKDCTVLAPDGFLTTWQQAAILAKKDSIMLRVGDARLDMKPAMCTMICKNFGFRVSVWGIMTNTAYDPANDGTGWKTLNL